MPLCYKELSEMMPLKRPDKQDAIRYTHTTASKFNKIILCGVDKEIMRFLFSSTNVHLSKNNSLQSDGISHDPKEVVN